MAARQDQTVVPTDTNVTSAGCDGAAQVDGTVNMEHPCMYVYVCVCMYVYVGALFDAMPSFWFANTVLSVSAY